MCEHVLISTARDKRESLGRKVQVGVQVALHPALTIAHSPILPRTCGVLACNTAFHPTKEQREAMDLDHPKLQDCGCGDDRMALPV
eukprot:1048850-Amphidinium_carterae.4